MSAADLARLYDLDLVEDPGDLDLYLALAARTGGPILELGVGTGRLAVPLAAAGYEVVGIDTDPAMLDRARARARAAGVGEADDGRLRLLEADMTVCRLPEAGRFGLAILALNTLFLVGGRAAQAAAVATLAAHLRPGGLAVVDVWLPTVDDLGRFDGRLSLEYVRHDAETDELVTKVVAAIVEPGTGLVELTTIYEATPPSGGPLRRWLRTERLRLVGPDELEGLVTGAGLVVETLAGDYALSPLAADSERAIVVARRPGRPGRRRRPAMARQGPATTSGPEPSA
ncbi:MAG TPA: class I SAM-dependent methyltransferase [Candidatus Binatia bacterium]|nr:class I SAM-dependent methyltransferase [Candidatus Binatia bacterium]